MREPVDIFLNRLYSSNDPLCMEAGATIENQLHKIKKLEEQYATLSLASKYMIESLFEIVEMSKSRDRYREQPREKDYIRELNLRLRECGEIATDTLKLDTINKAFENMRD